MRVGVAIGDSTAGMWAALGVLGAVIARDASGVGQLSRRRSCSGLVGLLNVQAQRYLSLRRSPRARTATRIPSFRPTAPTRRRDGPLNIATATQDMWRKLAQCLGLAALIQDPRFVDNSARFANRDLLKSLMEEKLQREDRNSNGRKILIDEGIPAGPIYNLAETFADPQVVHCGMVEEIEHAEIGALRQVASPIRMETLGDDEHPPAAAAARRTYARDVWPNMEYRPSASTRWRRRASSGRQDRMERA